MDLSRRRRAQPCIGNLIPFSRPVEDWRVLVHKTMPYASYLHVKNYSRDEVLRDIHS